MNRNLTIGERLKDLRVALGLNLEELAAQTGLSKSALAAMNRRTTRTLIIAALCYWQGSTASPPIICLAAQKQKITQTQLSPSYI